jgi:hypothetical protein
LSASPASLSCLASGWYQQNVPRTTGVCTFNFPRFAHCDVYCLLPE